MSLSPSEVHEYAVSARLTAFQQACLEIDKQLIASYDGERPMTVFICWPILSTDRILLNMVKEVYEPLGWEISSAANHAIEFSEIENSFLAKE